MYFPGINQDAHIYRMLSLEPDNQNKKKIKNLMLDGDI
jgi:hypothetical protein